MIEVGKMNELVVCGESDSGYYLKSEDSAEEIFMPPSLAPLNVKVGQKVTVFVYPDKTDRLIATNKVPHAVIGEYALLTAINVQDFVCWWTTESFRECIKRAIWANFGFLTIHTH